MLQLIKLIHFTYDNDGAPVASKMNQLSRLVYKRYLRTPDKFRT